MKKKEALSEAQKYIGTQIALTGIVTEVIDVEEFKDDTWADHLNLEPDMYKAILKIEVRECTKVASYEKKVIVAKPKVTK